MKLANIFIFLQLLFLIYLYRKEDTVLVQFAIEDKQSYGLLFLWP